MIIDAAKYNLLRLALVDQGEECDVIEVPPKRFALKKVHDKRILTAAMELLEDKRIVHGMTPYDTIKTFDQEITPEVGLYVLMCYAVAIQQGWIVHSLLMNKYYVNQNNQDAKQYVEDIHHTLLQ